MSGTGNVREEQDLPGEVAFRAGLRGRFGIALDA